MRIRTPVPIAAASAVSLLMALAGCGQGRPTTMQQGAANGFLDEYVRSNGRVARLDQGNDTVSEGQAYGMLLAELAGKPAVVRRIWQWTHTHLQEGNGLFAYHASPSGRVLGSQPASDADLLIAWALLRYQGPGAASLHAAGHKVAGAVLAHEVATGPQGMPVLTAGPWATGHPASLNPSYWSLPAFSALASLTQDPQWRRLATAAVTLTSQVTQRGKLLPPDWAAMSESGAVRAEPAPSGGQRQTQYGLDAQRTVAWFAASCDPRARALAGRWWRLLAPSGRPQAIALSPDGGVINGAPAPLALVASASAARAAGDRAAGHALLRRAAHQQRATPTYYGGAWTALGAALQAGTLTGC
jgi:endo-1,4-beta-D-glucanase Y